jgi:hypothetical protein
VVDAGTEDEVPAPEVRVHTEIQAKFRDIGLFEGLTSGLPIVASSETVSRSARTALSTFRW